MRKLHGDRNIFRRFVDSAAICPVCHVKFENRLRAIAHLTETRCRGKETQTCRSAVEAGRFEPLPERTVKALDAIDAKLRKDARAVGKTQVCVRIPTKRARARGNIGPESSENAATLPYRPAKRQRVKTSDSNVTYVLKRRYRDNNL